MSETPTDPKLETPRQHKPRTARDSISGILKTSRNIAVVGAIGQEIPAELWSFGILAERGIPDFSGESGRD